VAAAPYTTCHGLHQVMRNLVQGERFGDLAGDPFGRRISSHIGPNQPSPCQPQNGRSIAKLAADRRNHKQIDGSDVGSGCAEKPASPERVVGDAETCTWQPSTGRCRYRASAACNECAARPGASRLIAPDQISSAGIGRIKALAPDRSVQPFHLAVLREQAVKPHKDQPIYGAQPGLRGQAASRRGLLAAKCYFSFAGHARSKQPTGTCGAPLWIKWWRGGPVCPNSQRRSCVC
jgi:hypothetical protein